MYRNVGAEMIVTAPQVMLKMRDVQPHDSPSKRGIGETEEEYRTRYRETVKSFKKELETDGIDADTQKIMMEDYLRDNSQTKNNSQKEKISDDMLKSFGPVVGAFGTATVRQNISSREKENASHFENTALDKIEHLYKQVLDKGAVKSIDGKPLKGYIKEIFQLHQKNMGQSRVGERLNDKLDYACEQIASAIERGRMHPMALVHLVGEREIVKKEGKSIATQTEVNNALDAMCEKMPAKFNVDANEYISESTMTEDDLKHILLNLRGEARDLFMEIIPDEVLLHLGVTQEDIHETHLRTKNQFAKLLTTALMDMASMSEEELKAAKLTDAEIKLVYDLAEKGKTGDVKSVVLGISTHGEFQKGVEWPLANMKDYWEQVAAGTITVGAVYKERGEELTPERKAREEAEAKAAKEEEKKVAKKEPSGSQKDDVSEDVYAAPHTKIKIPEHEHHSHKKHANVSLAHSSKLKKAAIDSLDGLKNEFAANDEVPDGHVSNMHHHDRIEPLEAGINV